MEKQSGWGNQKIQALTIKPKMNRNSKALITIALIFLIYLSISVLDILFDFNVPFLKKVNLVSEFLHKNPNTPFKKNKIKTASPQNDPKERSLGLYTTPSQITSFNTDTSFPAMTEFMKKLQEIKLRKKRKVRIAFFGDSMIEGDLITQTLRELLQKEFGGRGVGYFPIQSVSSQSRTTLSSSASEGWRADNFRNTGNNMFFLSGYSFSGNTDWGNYTDNTIKDSSELIQKYLFTGRANGNAWASVNGVLTLLENKQPFNITLLSNDPGHKLNFNISSQSAVIFGGSIESENGIIVDNFSFRGSSGIELIKIDTSILRSIAQSKLYDLFVFQYGVNVLFRPNDIKFTWYHNKFESVIRELKSIFTDTDFLIVSSADRAFKYNDGYASAIGIDSLIKEQANIAMDTHCAFFNLFETMGGKNAIVRWVNEDPPAANKDYIHPNHKGAERIGHYFYDAIMKDYRKYSAKLEKK